MSRSRRPRSEPAGAPSPRRAPPPADAREALLRARRHARNAAAEALAALGALLDAGTLAGAGEVAGAHALLGPLARLLEGLRDRLEGLEAEADASLLAAVAEALDAEIARWEAHARRDPDARAVLRAFLGLRELLWEFGVRRPADGSAGPSGPRDAGRRPRVQRVPVEG